MNYSPDTRQLFAQAPEDKQHNHDVCRDGAKTTTKEEEQ